MKKAKNDALNGPNSPQLFNDLADVMFNFFVLPFSATAVLRVLSGSLMQRWKCRRLWLLSVGLVAVTACAQMMPAPPPGRIETGAPQFAVFGPDALGLSTPPNDLHLLPDGRILVTAAHELAFGDGVRWETFTQVDEPGQSAIAASVAVDHDGAIYTAANGGVDRIELLPGRRWRRVAAEKFPVEGALTTVSSREDRWYWFGASKEFVLWRPGQSPAVGRHNGAIDAVFSLGKQVYIAEQAVGTLFRLAPDGETPPAFAGNSNVSEEVTCAVAFAPGKVLLGTASAGLKLFDGKTFEPFGERGVLGRGHHVTDVCAISDDIFAASIDAIGVVFFSRQGRPLQMLDRSVDHRLGRVRRLLYTTDGVLWVLLSDGLARVEFPSPISDFNPLIPSGLAFASPLRHDGLLWILADGRAMRGSYNSLGVLERFEDDTPPCDYLFTLADVDGQLFGGSDKGIYIYQQNGWKLVVPDVVNARVGPVPSSNHDVFYVGKGEYGLLHRSGDAYTAVRSPVSGLGNNYNFVADTRGTVWLELGIGHVGQVDFHDGRPTLQILGPESGLPNAWVETYVLGGVCRFHTTEHALTFDETSQRFVDDVQLRTDFPELAHASGRPITDSQGRIWFTSVEGQTRMIEYIPGKQNRVITVPSAGFSPSGYTIQDDGVAWMFLRGRLVRLDLRVPTPAPRRPRVLITSVRFPSSNREIFAPQKSIGAVSYADNSFDVHFAAPANPFIAPLTFEVMLEGAGNQWVSNGTVGLTAFTQLKEGKYVFHVRAMNGSTPAGDETVLAFAVLPPWYRSGFAWTIYIAASIGLLAFLLWLSAALQRREKERLERLVAQRTSELNSSNEQLTRKIQETTEKSKALASSEERYRLLNTELEDRVQKRTTELEATHRKLLTISRQAGMAEVATDVLHNVGNVLNSVNVATDLVIDAMRNSRAKNLDKLSALLQEHASHLGAFLENDPKGKAVPAYVARLAEELREERERMAQELESLRKNVEHINEIVAMQQNYAKVSGVTELVQVTDVVEDALCMTYSSFAEARISIVREFNTQASITTERHKVMQILVNLLQNARHACVESARPDKQVCVRINVVDQRVQIVVSDNGVGIPRENLTRIFAHGFTTREHGHGFGLHSGALNAKQLGGNLTAQSNGPGSGATFTLELPVSTRHVAERVSA